MAGETQANCLHTNKIGRGFIGGNNSTVIWSCSCGLTWTESHTPFPRCEVSNMPKPEDRIDYTEEGDLDDIVINDVEMFRMERMSDGCFWIRCYKANGQDVVFHLNAVKNDKPETPADFWPKDDPYKIVGIHEHDPRVLKEGEDDKST